MQLVSTHYVMANQVGYHGNLFGGIMLSWIDEAGAALACQIADTGSLRSSYGLSIAWESPLGPIRFDFSRIAKKEDFDRTENFRFTFGTRF